jgi:hypothetical protein
VGTAVWDELSCWRGAVRWGGGGEGRCVRFVAWVGGDGEVNGRLLEEGHDCGRCFLTRLSRGERPGCWTAVVRLKLCGKKRVEGVIRTSRQRDDLRRAPTASYSLPLPVRESYSPEERRGEEGGREERAGGRCCDRYRSR